jgi:hypothetical protein
MVMLCYGRRRHMKEPSLLRDVALNSTFRYTYIDDVLSIHNNQFHSYFDSIYPNELEIEDSTVFNICFVFGYIIENGC